MTKYYLIAIDKTDIDMIYVYTSDIDGYVKWRNWAMLEHIDKVNTDVPLQTLKKRYNKRGIHKLNRTQYNFEIMTEVELVALLL
jgi:hypothetical protein